MTRGDRWKISSQAYTRLSSPRRCALELSLRAQGWLVEWKEIDDASLAVMLARHIHDRARERIDAIPNRRGTAIESRSPSPTECSRPWRYSTERASVDQVDPEHAFFSRSTSRGTRRSGRATWDPAHLERAPSQRASRAPDRHPGLARDHERGPNRSPLRLRAVGRRPPHPEQSSRAFLLSGKQMRVIASVYTGSTEKRAIDDLVGLGAQVRISYDTTQTRLHAKSWLFERAPSSTRLMSGRRT